MDKKFDCTFFLLGGGFQRYLKRHKKLKKRNDLYIPLQKINTIYHGLKRFIKHKTLINELTCNLAGNPNVRKLSQILGVSSPSNSSQFARGGGKAPGVERAQPR